MYADKLTELSRIKLKNLNSTARPYDQQAFSPLDLTARKYIFKKDAMTATKKTNFVNV